MIRRSLAVGALLCAACTDPVATPVPADLIVLHAPRAVSVPGQRFDTVSVRLLAADGTPIVGWRLAWSGDGTVEPYDSATDEQGIARARWTLPRSREYAFGLATGPSGRFRLAASVVGFREEVIETAASVFTADQVDASSDTGCGLRGAHLWCWGGFSVFGDPQVRPVEVSLPTGGIPIVFRVGWDILCLLDEAHLPWCRSIRTEQAWWRVAGAPALSDLTIVEAASSTSAVCGRALSDQRAWCWSQRDGATVAALPISERAFASIDGGFRHACAIDPEGRGWCWGLNDHGQLGAGDKLAHDTLVEVVGDHRFERISAGDFLTCASDIAHRIWCWGRTAQSEDSSVPVLVDQPWAVGPEIAVGEWYEVYVQRGGVVRAWSMGAEMDFLSQALATYPVATMGSRGPWCLRTTSGEVHCSMGVLYAITDVFYPGELLPVPDPAAFED